MSISKNGAVAQVRATPIKSATTFANLPDASENAESYYFVIGKTGTYGDALTPLRRKGIYYSDGINWLRAEIPAEIGEQIRQRVLISDIVNTVESTEINKPLSANQGRVLQEQINSLGGSAFKQASRFITSSGNHYYGGIFNTNWFVNRYVETSGAFTITTADGTNNVYTTLADAWNNIDTLSYA